MKQLIDRIDTENFKSMKGATIKGCRRINLFIGRPNVGKSNILEALSTFTIPYLSFLDSRNLNSLLRCENGRGLFYSGNYENPAIISTSIGNYYIKSNGYQGLGFRLSYNGQEDLVCHFDDRLDLKGMTGSPNWI